MNCTKCGKEIPDGENKLCDECKNSLLSNLETEEEDTGSKFEIKKNQKPDKDEPKAKKGKGKWIILIILILAIAAIAYVEYSSHLFTNMIKGDNTVGIDIGNNNNNLGCANIQGDWIYYMSLANDGTEIALNKVKTDGTEKQILAQKDWEIYSINVVGNYLYFVAFEPTPEDQIEAESTATAYQNNKIYKMSLDGKEVQVINDGDFSNEGVSIYVIEDKIFYIGKDYNIYSMDTDGGNRTKLNDTQTGFVGVTDKYILFNDYPENPENERDFVTYVMDLDGSNKRIVNGKRLYNPNLIGDTIYYVNSDNNAIHRVNVDGKNDEMIYKSKAYNMNVKGDWIYYLDYKDPEADSSDDTVCIHKVRTDGTGHQIIVEMENYTSFINVLGDWIYYTDHSDNAYYINLIKTDGSRTLNLYQYDFNVSTNEVTENTEATEETKDNTATNEITIANVVDTENTVTNTVSAPSVTNTVTTNTQTQNTTTTNTANSNVTVANNTNENNVANATTVNTVVNTVTTNATAN